MADDPQKRFEQDLNLDPSVSGPLREGLVGTAPGGLYARDAAAPREVVSLPPDGRPLSEQPQWRRDFPIDWPQDQYVARRDFAKFLVVVSASFAAGQAWIAGKEIARRSSQTPFPRRRIAALADVPVGGSLEFAYPEDHDRCILARPHQGELVAYSQLCTHLSCAVIPDVAEGLLRCPCHEGLFDLATGRNIAGPPPRPLPRITLEVQGGEIFATGVEERTV